MLVTLELSQIFPPRPRLFEMFSPTDPPRWQALLEPRRPISGSEQ